MQAIRVNLYGHELYLLFNMSAWLEIEGRFGTDYLEKLGGGTTEAFKMSLDILCILSEQGELARRRMGYTCAPFLEREGLETITTPNEFLKMKRAIEAAIVAGFDQEVEQTEDIDLTLLEFQKKTESR